MTSQTDRVHTSRPGAVRRSAVILAVIACAMVWFVGGFDIANAEHTSPSVAPGPRGHVAQDGAATKSVWAGIYNDAQAKRGQEQYRTHCGGCHLESLGGADMAPAMVGEAFLTQWNDLAVGALFDRIRISMPQDTPASLSRQAYVDIVAYILMANKFPAGNDELSHDIAALKQIKILIKAPERQ